MVYQLVIYRPQTWGDNTFGTVRLSVRQWSNFEPQTGEVGNSNTRMDRCYQMYYLPCFAVDNQTLETRKGSLTAST